MVCEKLKFQLLKRARFVRGARAVAFLFLLSFVFGIPVGESSASPEVKYSLNKDVMAAIQNQIETIEKLPQETQDQAKEKFLSYFRLAQFVDSALSFLEFPDVEKDGKLKEELGVQGEQIFNKARALLSFFEKDHEIVTSSFLYFLIIHFYERLWNEDGLPGHERSLHEEALSKTLGFSSKEEMYEFKRLISDFFKSLPVFEQLNEKIDFLLKVHLEAKRLDERPLAPSPYLKELESENKEFREFVEHLWRETRIVTYLEFVSGSKSFGVPQDKGIDIDLYLGLRGRAAHVTGDYRTVVDRYFPKLRGEIERDIPKWVDQIANQFAKSFERGVIFEEKIEAGLKLLLSAKDEKEFREGRALIFDRSVRHLPERDMANPFKRVDFFHYLSGRPGGMMVNTDELDVIARILEYTTVLQTSVMFPKTALASFGFATLFSGAEEGDHYLKYGYFSDTPFAGRLYENYKIIFLTLGIGRGAVAILPRYLSVSGISFATGYVSGSHIKEREWCQATLTVYFGLRAVKSLLPNASRGGVAGLLDESLPQIRPTIRAGDGASLFEGLPYRLRVRVPAPETTPAGSQGAVRLRHFVTAKEPQGALVKVSVTKPNTAILPEAPLFEPVRAPLPQPRLRGLLAPKPEVIPQTKLGESLSTPHRGGGLKQKVSDPHQQPTIFIPKTDQSSPADEDVWIIRREGDQNIGIRKGKRESIQPFEKIFNGDGTFVDLEDGVPSSIPPFLLEIIQIYRKKLVEDYLKRITGHEALFEKLKALGTAVVTEMAIDLSVRHLVQEATQTPPVQNTIEKLRSIFIEKIIKENTFTELTGENDLPKLAERFTQLFLNQRGEILGRLIDLGVDDEAFLVGLEQFDIKGMTLIPFVILPRIRFTEVLESKEEGETPDNSHKGKSSTSEVASPVASVSPPFDWKETIPWNELTAAERTFLEEVYEPQLGMAGFVPFGIEGRISRITLLRNSEGPSGFRIQSRYGEYEILIDPDLISSYILSDLHIFPRRLVVRELNGNSPADMQAMQNGLQRLVRDDVYLNRYLKPQGFEKPFYLNPYQKMALRLTRGHRALGHKKALVVLPTGVGKTIFFIEDAIQFVKEHPEAKILVVVDTQALAAQLAYEFKMGWRRAMSSDPALSLKSVGTLFSGETSGLHTDIVIALRQSLVETNGNGNVGEVSVRHFPRDFFQYLIFDEAHHIPNRSLQAISTYFKTDFELGVTATPQHEANAIRRHFGHDEKALYEVYAEEAVAAGFLCDLEIISPQKAEITKEGLLSQYRSDIKHFSRTPRTVVFTSSIAHAQEIEKWFADENIKVVSLTSTSHPSQREKEGVIDRFVRREIDVLVVVDVLNEGIDIPAIDLVFFLRKTESLRIYLQQLGRGLRSAPGKPMVRVRDWVNNRIFATRKAGDQSGIHLDITLRRESQKIKIRRAKKAFTTEEEIKYRDFCEWLRANLIHRWTEIIVMPYHLGQARADFERAKRIRFGSFGNSLPSEVHSKIREAYPEIYYLDRYDKQNRYPWMQQFVVLMEYWKKDPEMMLDAIIAKYNKEIRYRREANGIRTLHRQDIPCKEVTNWIEAVPELAQFYETQIGGLERYLAEKQPQLQPSRGRPSQPTATPSPTPTSEPEGPKLSIDHPDPEQRANARSEGEGSPPAVPTPTEAKIRQVLDFSKPENRVAYGHAIAVARESLGLLQKDLGREVFGREGNVIQKIISNAEMDESGSKKNQPVIIAKLIEIAKGKGVRLEIEDFSDEKGINEKFTNTEGSLGLIARIKERLDFSQLTNRKEYGQAIAAVREALGLSQRDLGREVFRIEGNAAQVIISNAEIDRHGSQKNQPMIIAKLIEIAKGKGVGLEIEDFSDEKRIKEKFMNVEGALGLIARIEKTLDFSQPANRQMYGHAIAVARGSLGRLQKDLGSEVFRIEENAARNIISNAERGRDGSQKNQPVIIAKLILLAQEKGVALEISDFSGPIGEGQIRTKFGVRGN